MRINYIELRNYRKFERVKLELPDGVIGIVGNNGVGKSTLVESISWALFGNQKDIVREGKESVRKDNASPAEPTSVKVEFSYASDEYIVSREMSGKSLSIDASLIINGKLVARGANEVSKEIEKKLGMDYKSFFISVFARQKDLAALSALTESERQKTIVRMLGIDRLDNVIKEISAKDRLQRERTESLRENLLDEKGNPKDQALKEKKIELSKRKDDASREIAILRREQDGLKSDETELNKRAIETSGRLKHLVEVENKFNLDQAANSTKKKELEQAKKNLEEAKKAEESREKLKVLRPELESLKKKRTELLGSQKESERFEKLREEIDFLEKESSELKEDISQQSMKKKALSEELERIEQTQKKEVELETELLESKDKFSELREKSKSMTRELERDEKHLNQINKLGPDSKCPTCERPLGEHYGGLKERLSESIKDSHEEIEILEKSIQEIEASITDRNKRLEALAKKIKSLGKEEKEYAQLEKSIELKEKELTKVKERLSRLKIDAEKISEKKFDQSMLEKIDRTLEELEEERDRLVGLSSLAKNAPDLERAVERFLNELKQLDERLKSYQLDPAEKELLESGLEEIEKKRTELRRQAEQLNESLVRSSENKASAISELNAVEKELTELSGKLEHAKQLEEELAYITKLQEITKGFREHLIARIIPTLSQIASELMNQLTDGRYTSLTLDNGYNIFINDGGAEHILDRFSGGETDLANLCLRLAISRVIAERTYTEGINLLVLDEIFGSQDAARKRNLLNSFNNLSKQFRQIVLITHVEDIRDQLGTILEVYQDESGNSHVRPAV